MARYLEVDVHQAAIYDNHIDTELEEYHDEDDEDDD